MKNINILRALEANKENRQFQLVPNRQNRIQSTINFKEELIPKPKQNIIRLTKWNKSSRLRVRGLEETRQVSYEAPKPKPELFQHYQRTLKNRSLTNIQVTMPSQSVPCSVPQSANSKKQTQIQHEQLQRVIPYSNEIIDHLIKSSRQQHRNQFKGLFLQAQITERMRNTLLNWILEVHYKLKLQPETLFLTISIIDRFIEKEQVQQCKFQLLGISSLFIAGKYQEVYGVPKSSHLAQFCDEAFTREDILRMEGQILLTLNFDLGMISALQIVEHLGQDDPLISYGFGQGDPLELGCAAILISDAVYKKSTELGIININSNVRSSMAKQLIQLWQNEESLINFPSLFRKYNQNKYQEVSRLKVNANIII